MIVTFYSFLKRSRSTARPSEGGVAIDCYLKEGTSRHEPTFVLEWNEMPVWNMATAFDNAYYWIQDVVAVHDGIYEVQCTIDLLATHRNSIENSRQLVAYCQNGSTALTDNRNPASAVTETFTVQGGTPFSYDGSFTVVFASKFASPVSGACAAYSVSYTELSAIIDALYVDTIEEAIKKFFVSPMDAVISCTYVPFGPVGGAREYVYFGGYNSGIIAHNVNTGYKTWTETITVPYSKAYPNGARNYQWYKPYCNITINLPCVGLVDIDPGLLTGTAIRCECSIYVITGDLVWTLIDVASETLIGTYSGSCGQSLPVSGGSFDFNKMLSGFMASLGGAAQTFINPIGGAASMIGGVSQMVGGLKQSTQINGAISSPCNLRTVGGNIWLSLYVNRPIASASNYGATIGLPYFRSENISNLSGYIQTIGADLPSVAEFPEIEQVCRIMDGGFWYE